MLQDKTGLDSFASFGNNERIYHWGDGG
jgi:hypothetical protein